MEEEHSWQRDQHGQRPGSDSELQANHASQGLTKGRGEKEWAGWPGWRGRRAGGVFPKGLQRPGPG